ncbi:MAG: holo-ACP synthase [Lentisphaeria bacterium]|nr:holo-ACP synthase [Lentisphaeria bacterium]
MSIERTGQAFLEKVYSPDELEAMPSKDPRRIEFLAGRWAAKEALAKALGCGISDRCRLNEITVLNDGAGRPVMTLEGASAETAHSMGVSKIHISISHEKAYATAVVILE